DIIDNTLMAAVVNVNMNPQTKILSEGAAAGAILAGQGADNINSALLSGLQEGKAEVIASIFGGSSKYDTGSSVEMNVFGITAGIAKKFNSTSAGIFAEYSDASFDTEYNGSTGDGKATATGVGVLVKRDMQEDIYIEGLVRAGQLSNDYKTKLDDGLGTTADFDYSTTYFGLSLGVGQILKINEKINIDAYGKYALTSVGRSDADLTTGEKYKIDPTISNKIKAGAKGEYKISETIKPYLSLAYDYELSGDVNAKIDGYEVEAPSLNGGTFSGGLGVSAKLAEKLTLDLSAQIYSGVRDGVTGNLQVKYQF
ncbi:MAG: autotransporter outer membrane beta-barrel domain-containing protein, partial [Endomicrobia bacterium]|nr:autotransporter outer membrane beta-barrel domain-containing protein [Endomicrobiia bacterium]